jgi:simple sugar transport system ATP-binding protein
MRNGRVTGDVRAADTDARELARMMVGRDVDLSPRRAPRAPAAPVLRVRLDGIELDVRAGELVGVAGVAGNGQLELAETIAGLRTPPAGRVEIGGVDVTGRGARAARRAGLAYVPEDRLGTGLAPSLTIAENLLLTRRRGFFVNRRRAAAQARDAIERFDIKASGPDAVTRVLSGGNAQRVLLARELAGEPRVLVAAAPTRGLDVGATEAVRELLDAFRARGGAVLLLSEDLDEVLALSDRIVVLYRGRIAHETPGDGADVEQIGYAMAGVV